MPLISDSLTLKYFVLYLVIETLGRVHLVTEFIQGGELYYRIVQNGVFPENKAVKIFRQIGLAVQHMVSPIYIKARPLK